MSDPRLGFPFDEIKNRYTRRLAAGPGGRGNRNQRLEWSGDGPAAADGSIDIVKKFRRMRGIKIRHLGRIDRAPAADRDERIELPSLRSGNRFVKALVRRLRLHCVENLKVAIGRSQRLDHNLSRR